jgi:hypothetical protein
MVRLLARKPRTVFRVFDREGRPIGEVVLPETAPVVGVGAKTVLLIRGEEESLLPAQYSLLRV